MSDIKKDIVKKIEDLIVSNLKYQVSESLEDIVNKNNSSFSYPSEIEFSISYNKNKNELRLDILTRYFEGHYIDLYYKEEGMKKERKIVYYKDEKRDKEIYIKNADISPDKYIIPIVQYYEDHIFDKNGKIISTNIEEEHEYVDVSSFEDIIAGIKEILQEHNVQPLNIYDYRVLYPHWRRFKLSGLT